MHAYYAPGCCRATFGQLCLPQKRTGESSLSTILFLPGPPLTDSLKFAAHAVQLGIVITPALPGLVLFFISPFQLSVRLKVTVVQAVQPDR
jgi:hypothetical protein